MNLKITKLTNNELESISGGKTKIKIKEKRYGTDSLSAITIYSLANPKAGVIGGIFFMLLGAVIFGVSVHNLPNKN